jgi:hypothetical protein
MADKLELSEEERSELLSELIKHYQGQVKSLEEPVKLSLILREALKHAGASVPDETADQKLLREVQEKLKALEAYQEHLKSKK